MNEKVFSYDEFCTYVSVPRETYAKLSEYVMLIEKWQKTINLISSATLGRIWVRHIIDSAQLFGVFSIKDKVADLGSGAGLPGLVLGAMGVKDVTLIESDVRKSAFLKEAARIMNLSVKIISDRVEVTDMNHYSLIVARGFARLPNLLATIKPTLNSTYKLLLLKGKNYISEIEESQKQWLFEYRTIPSITDSEGAIIEMQHISPRKKV